MLFCVALSSDSISFLKCTLCSHVRVISQASFYKHIIVHVADSSSFAALCIVHFHSFAAVIRFSLFKWCHFLFSFTISVFILTIPFSFFFLFTQNRSYHRLGAWPLVPLFFISYTAKVFFLVCFYFITSFFVLFMHSFISSLLTLWCILQNVHIFIGIMFAKLPNWLLSRQFLLFLAFASSNGHFSFKIRFECFS